MPEWTRVRDKDTGHEYSTRTVLPDAHQVLDKDAADAYGRPLPAKPRRDLRGNQSTPPNGGAQSSDAGPTGSETE
ncbi:MAG: hypothetical protein J2P24_00365 [Streptosporangiales bacterium]|nr:hypothetical protein [Streptosporangiales bacterium]